MKGKAVGKGCGSIMSAYATGKGIAFAIDLGVFAEAEVKEGGGLLAECSEDPEMDTLFIETCVKNTLGHLGEEVGGLRVKTWGDLPTARGLKSSSAAGNAVILATARAVERRIDKRTVVDINTSSAIEASVTTAGSLDDTCASLYGGVVMTDYGTGKIVGRSLLDPELRAVILSRPRDSSGHAKVDKDRFRPYSPLIEHMFAEAQRGKIFETMIVNGLIHTSMLGFNSGIIHDAMNAGAMAASLSGKGPAFIALVEEENLRKVIEAWAKYPGEVVVSGTDNEGSKAI